MLKQVNWLDIFVVIIFIRVFYVSIKSGFPLELFKLLGLILTTCLSLHYYSRLGSFISASLGQKNVSLVFLDFIAFILLCVSGLSIGSLLRRLLFKLVKVEAVSNLNKWGGFVIGIVRAFLFSSLIVFMFVISGVGYLHRSVTTSYSGKRIFMIAPLAYSRIFSGVVSKFYESEKFNQAVLEAEKGLNKFTPAPSFKSN